MLSLDNETTDHRGAEQSVDNAVEPELFRGNRELAVDWQYQNRVQFPRAHELGNVCDVHEKERLEQLRDDLVCADQQHHFPFCPVADVIDIPKNDAEKNDLAAEPKNLHHHPQQEVRLETQIPDERVAQHDGIDFDVTAHHVWLSSICEMQFILALSCWAKRCNEIRSIRPGFQTSRFVSAFHPEMIRYFSLPSE